MLNLLFFSFDVITEANYKVFAVDNVLYSVTRNNTISRNNYKKKQKN